MPRCNRANVTTDGLGLIALAAAARCYRPTRGTTLRAVWWWAVLAMSVVAGPEAFIAAGPTANGGGAGGYGENWIESLRLAAAAATFCPPVALFGAKRPQDRAWQWIVLSFWVVSRCRPHRRG